MTTTVPIPTTDLAVDQIELGDILQWMRPDREGIFAKLRAEAPISFHTEPVPPPEVNFPQGPGFWALTRYADVMQVSRAPETFHSAPSINIGDIPPEIAEWLGSMINMDAPKHTKMRLIVNRGFTPRQVAKIEENVRQQAREIVDEIVTLGGECDFVSEVAAALPLQIICDMLGIPRSETKRIFELTNTILGVGDPEYVSTLEELMGAGMELFQYGIELAQDRLDNPRDDITTTLMQAEIEDENGRHKLTTAELGSFFLLLVAAGNETTRNAISHGMLALTRNPEQRALWTADPAGVSDTAVEEIVRWASPVIHFRRTAFADAVVGGQEIKAGQKVVMFYNSANRDERAFPDPFKFDVMRTPNEHAGFGAGGPHFCLGANLARREIKLMFEELFRRLPDLEISGEPDYLQSAFIHGIKRMPCTWHKVND
jgi:methyl-branched lipid omega-hydroxylase